MYQNPKSSQGRMSGSIQSEMLNQDRGAQSHIAEMLVEESAKRVPTPDAETVAEITN